MPVHFPAATSGHQYNNHRRSSGCYDVNGTTLVLPTTHKFLYNDSKHYLIVFQVPLKTTEGGIIMHQLVAQVRTQQWITMIRRVTY